MTTSPVITLRIPSDLLARMPETSPKHGEGRTAFILEAIREKLAADEPVHYLSIRKTR